MKKVFFLLAPFIFFISGMAMQLPVTLKEAAARAVLNESPVIKELPCNDDIKAYLEVLRLVSYYHDYMPKAISSATQRGLCKLIPGLLDRYAQETGVERNVLVNVPYNDAGDTLLVMAARNGNRKVIRTLVGCGAQVDIKTLAAQECPNEGKTPLMVAAKLGYSKAVLYLLALQANVNETDAQEFTALMYAAQAEPWANTFCPTSSGMVFRNYAETVRLLLRHGAQTDVSNTCGDTALDIARASGNATLIRMLESAQAAKPHKGTRVCLK